MTWADFHTKSERLAGQAEAAFRMGEPEKAQRLYVEAAEAEIRAIEELDKSKKRTLGISTVSAAALWYKAKQYDHAENFVYEWLSTGLLSDFAIAQLKELLQSIWNETIRQKAGIKFAPGQVIVSVKGGEVVTGGAPLDLIVEKVQTVQSMFYRTAEFLNELPHRIRGGPSQEIREMFRPWLFQTVAGSYQFAIAVQEPIQPDIFKLKKPKSHEVAARFLQIVRASLEDPDASLAQLVPDIDYRGTFLKLTRNLAPTGKSFQSMEIRSPEDVEPITLIPSSREIISEVLRRQRQSREEKIELREETITGVLRAVHLDQDWLEVTVGQEHVRVEKVGEAVDDVIGPMVNRPVIVQTIKDQKGRYLFRDIEPAE